MNQLRAALFASLAALSAALGSARAEEPGAASQATPTPSPLTTTTPLTQAPAVNPDAFDFDLSEQSKVSPTEEAAKKKRAEELDHKVKLRRKMLVAHQAIGFATLGVMAATLVVGQLNYVSRYDGFNNGKDYNRFQLPHLGLAISTTALFTTLGILGVAAPNPYPKPIKLDSALVHKVAMALATAGMVTQMVLGPITSAFEGKLNQRDMALGHLVVGYATWGFMATGVIAYTF